MLRRGVVALVTLGDGEDLIDPAFSERFGAVLDGVVGGDDDPGALVITGEGRFFGNGFAPEAMLDSPPADRQRLFSGFCALVARLLVLPLPTVAALNGHCMAAGALLALACDYRAMRADGGWLCLSEVDRGTPIHPALIALLRAKLPEASLRDALLTGRRYGGEEALAARFVDATAAGGARGDGVVERAIEIATTLASKDRRTFAAMKAALYGETRDTLVRACR